MRPATHHDRTSAGSTQRAAVTRRSAVQLTGAGILGGAGVRLLSGCGAEPVVAVTGEVSATRAAAYHDLVLTCLPLVEELWGTGSVPRPVRIDLPRTVTAWARSTGHRAQQRGYAASTVRTGAAARIVMHPDAWLELTPAGRAGVVTHEITHQAMGRGGGAPWWLGEGLAEYTAHRHSTRSVASIAGSALNRAVADPPASWPQPSAGIDAWQGYAQAWLACVFLARRAGERSLMRFYTSVSAGTPLSVALQATVGAPESDVHRGWVSWLGQIERDAQREST